MPSLPRVHKPIHGHVHQPYANSRTAAKRITGRALQTRNERIKIRDGYRCNQCGRVTDDGEVDHIVNLAQWDYSKGNPEQDTNLQWLCRKPCHAEKSRREAVKGRIR